MNKFITVTEARKNLYAVIDEAGQPGFAVAITHEGIPKVVVMSFEEYEGWQETMELMADPSFEKEMREGIRQMKAGDVVDFEIVKNKRKRKVKR